MTPAEAKQPDTYLEIVHPYGGKRYPAHIFDLNQGIAWIEYGWASDDPLAAPNNPIHMVEGKVEATRDGQWQIQSEDGLVTIRTMAISRYEDDSIIIKLSELSEGDRALARERIEASLNIKLPPHQ
ncbi:hypothetical protein [Endozoicomonas sp. ONNA2]|uniref:hypothetical protein n=1 Tax=Endozoicomonas sp. ONNA2 TaxID=2828741 RepID=UPI00214866DD|nr:hypothetical protein [Endozoicomonas sp. ONNA2]